MRIVLYTGKGGVGKTSVAAATALHAAKMGYKTIVMSTDAAHSLADSFDMPLDSSPVPITDNLWGQEIDVYTEMETYWSTVQDWLTALMQWQGVDDVVAQEMAILPGMEELVGLLYISRHYEEDYDFLIVDCAPTGETLRLLSFPEVARWYMRRLFPIERKVATALGPFARTLFNLPVPNAKVFDTIQSLFDQLERMRDILTSPQTSSVRLVVNPERMVIKEAQRTLTYLDLYGYHTDLIVCNRLLPSTVGDSFFDAWKESQTRNLDLIHEAFSPIPILTAPLMDREAIGLEALEELAGSIYDHSDPTEILYQGKLQELAKDGNNHVMRIALPFVTKEEVSLLLSGQELVVQAGRHRRSVVFPRVLSGLAIEEATVDGNTLKLRFQVNEKSK